MDREVREAKVAARDARVPVTTLLELVAAVAKEASSSSQIAAKVTDLVNARRVELVGNFRARDIQGPR